MRIQINTTGTHIHKGLLKVRFDFIPDVEDKTYVKHYVEHFDELGNSLGFYVNSCLSHFVVVPETISLDSLKTFAQTVFSKDLITSLDNYLLLPNSAHYISELMRPRSVLSAEIVKSTNIAYLIDSVNASLSSLAFIMSADGKLLDIEPKSIDIGGEAIHRGSTQGANFTYICRHNLANADGTIDTWQVYAESNISGFSVATFYAVDANHWSTRDYEDIGSITSGSTQTFSGLSTDVLTGDSSGAHWTGGNLSRDDSGGDNTTWYRSGDYIPCSSILFGDSGNYRIHSIYGTGTEGGVTEKTSAEAGAGVESVTGRGLAEGEAGSGIESLHSRSLAVPDGGSGVEEVTGRALLAGDTGQGAEFAHILGLWEVLFSGDAGRGFDSLKALTARAGHDMKIQPGYGRVGLPHKEVNR
jgi:hypothetical protein